MRITLIRSCIVCREMKYKLIVTGALFIAFSVHVAGQGFSTRDFDGEIKKYEQEVSVTFRSDGHGTTAHSDVGDVTQSQNSRYIVLFSGTPKLLLDDKQVQARQDASNKLAQFRSDFEEIQGQFRSTGSQASGGQILREYDKILLGAAISASPEVVQRVRSLSYVTGVLEDAPVQAHLPESVSLIAADTLRSNYNITGRGIKVGIIDTGIDYTHPALGGGYGKGFKVVGGYDFVNEDTDPMDDNYHGTHVAGIVAADDGQTQGVAPGCKLYALKVLDANGSGFESDIVEAIEWTVDPNGDDDPSDRLDVVNMSLGGNGDDQSAGAIAVNNAVELGVVFCVSAGNSGGYETIGSPGTAEKAITVGASGDIAYIASFSSKGPNPGNYQIKPDVVAPGVDINSTVLNGDWQDASGTSMSSPHVAGVAALLLDLHPQWTPEQIKSALTSTASLISGDVMTEGTGVIRSLDAAAVTTFISPTQLNFGANEPEDEWSGSSTLTVTNDDASTQSYQIEQDGMANGLYITTSPPSFTLAPGESQLVNITMNVDNGVYENSSTHGLYEGGLLSIEGTKDTLSVPWAFITASFLKLQFEDNFYPTLYVMSEEGFAQTGNLHFNHNGSKATMLIPEGTYDLFFLLDDWSYIVSREQVEVKGITKLRISLAEAKNHIALQALDQSEQPISGFDQSSTGLIMSGRHYNDTGFGILFGSKRDTIHFSDLSKNYSLIINDLLRQGTGNLETTYAISYPKLSGLKAPVHLKGGGDQLRSADLDLVLPGGRGTHEAVLFNTITWGVRDYYNFGWFGSGGHMKYDGFEWKGEFHLTPIDTTDYLLSPLLSMTKQVGADSIYWLQTPKMGIYEDMVGFYPGAFPLPGQVLAKDGEMIPLGNNLSHIGMYDGLRYYESLWRLKAFGSGMESANYLHPTTELTVFDDDDNVITQGNIYSGGLERSLAAGTYRFVHTGKGFNGEDDETTFQLTSTTTIQNDFEWPYAPNFVSLQLTNSRDEQVRNLRNEDGYLHFTIRSGDRPGHWEYDSPLATASYRISGTNNFTDLPVEPVATDQVYTSFRVPIEGLKGRYDIRLTATNEIGDSAELLIGEGLVVSNGTEPTIVSQNEILLARNQAYRLTPADFTILDSDSKIEDIKIVPLNGFEENYTLSDSIIVPDPRFQGSLVVQVRASDGENLSDIFTTKIEVKNDVPRITGQNEMIGISGQAMYLSLVDLVVEDLDDNYPDNFELIIKDRATEEYQINGNQITSEPTFEGDVRVKVRVSDGLDVSEPYNLTIKMLSPIPRVLGQESKTMYRNEALVIHAEELEILDHDTDRAFIVNIHDGDNYHQSGVQWAVDDQFVGNLSVAVSVSDGTFESDVFQMSVEVANHLPKILQQERVVMTSDESLLLSLDLLDVQDEDDEYPGDFELIVFDSTGYSFDASVVSPLSVGSLAIPIRVSDGFDESETYIFHVEVLKVADENGFIYPNPVSETLYVDFNDTSVAYEVWITDMEGKIHFRTEIANEETGEIFSIASLPPGNYFLFVRDESGRTEVNRFIKQ